MKAQDEVQKGGVYVLRVGKYFYFGKSKNLRRRFTEHLGQLRKGMHKNIILQRAFKKHGEDKLSFEPVVWCGPDDASRIEAEIIQSCKNVATCANLRLEDGTTFSHSEESRRKMSEAARGKPKSEEHCRKLSEAHRGKTCSKEHRRKIGEGVRAAATPEYRRKLSEARRGRTFSEEHRRKLSEATKASMTPERRRKLSVASKNRSPETRRKLSEAAKRQHAARRAAKANQEAE